MCDIQSLVGWEGEAEGLRISKGQEKLCGRVDRVVPALET